MFEFLSRLQFDFSKYNFFSVEFLLIILAFFIVREVYCWYMKINAQLHTQRLILETLEDILAELRTPGAFPDESLKIFNSEKDVPGVKFAENETIPSDK
jgi:hypothetical protein